MMINETCSFTILSPNVSVDEQDMVCFPMPGPPLYSGAKLGLFTGLYIFIFVTGFSGNLLTSLVIIKTKELQSNTNYFLCNLAFSDLVLLLSGVPFDVLYIWRPYPAIAGTWFCVLKGWLSETAANVSILTILMLTLERWVAVCWPLHLFIVFKRQKVFRYILFVWCIGGTVALILAVQLGVVPYHHPTKPIVYGNITQCDVEPTRAIPYIFEVFTLLFFVIPIIVIISSYMSIVRELKRPPNALSQLGNMNQPQLRARYLIVKMCILVSSIFIICFLPLHIQRLLTTYLKNQLQESFDSAAFIQTWFVVSGLLHFVSAACNPLIYNAVSKKFRLACIHLIRSLCLTKFYVKCYTPSFRPSNQNPTTQTTPLRSRFADWLFRWRSSSRHQFSLRNNKLIDSNNLNDIPYQEELL